MAAPIIIVEEDRWKFRRVFNVLIVSARLSLSCFVLLSHRSTEEGPSPKIYFGFFYVIYLYYEHKVSHHTLNFNNAQFDAELYGVIT